MSFVNFHLVNYLKNNFKKCNRCNQNINMHTQTQLNNVKNVKD